MDYNNFREKVYYINLKDILIYSFIIGIIYSFFKIMLLFQAYIVVDLFNVLELIVSMILLMFSIHLESITEEEFTI